MAISTNLKGVLSLIQSLLLVFGTSTYIQDPHNFYGLGIAIAGAVIGAIKHWVDTQDGTSPTPTPGTPA